jgi:hypothetical protein
MKIIILSKYPFCIFLSFWSIGGDFFCWNSLNWRKFQLKLQIWCGSFSMQIQMNSSWAPGEFMMASETIDKVLNKI